ncbi:MAG: TonB-dependent receptor [Bacteroidales bacterium]|nr:TonB-dependent receptor [Bacteroidales bacterium]
MFKKALKLKADVVRWHQFSRRNDAVFRSLGREIVIGTLSVSTLLVATPHTAQAQTVAPQQGERDREVALDEVTVTAGRVPLPMEQTARIVSVMTREQLKDCPAQSVNDLLKLCASVDVRQRGSFGIQTDISINGGTHDQIVILLNGVNISSPHTGHLSADLPISIDDIERIEILEGAASRVYGTSAFCGAINIVTKAPSNFPEWGRTPINGAIGVNGGSFGTWGGDASINLSTHHLSTGYQQSDGGTPNSDFKKVRAFYQGSYALPLGREGEGSLQWQLGMSRMDYGANTFYSGKYPNQYEENRRYMGSVSAQTKGRIVIAPTLYFNRSLDHYQLVRGTATGENFHMTDVYGLTVNARTNWAWGTSSVGADFRNEGILSTALGRPLTPDLYVGIPGHDGQYTKKDNRTNICYFLEHDVLLRRWTLSLGLMANMNTGLDYRYRLYPGIDVSYRPSQSFKLFASWNMAQRMPTFTDLYYKSPTQEGNTGLKPERTNEFAMGTTLRLKGFSANVRAFHRHESSMIDWVMTPADAANGFTTYHAANFRLDKMGVNLSSIISLLPLNTHLSALSLSYTYLHQKRYDNVDVVASSYALDYLRHKFVARLEGQICKGLKAALTYRWQQRMGNYMKYAAGTSTAQPYASYGLLDLRITYTAPRFEVYCDANNLTSYRYYDLGNVLQPGFWFMGGAKWKF